MARGHAKSMAKIGAGGRNTKTLDKNKFGSSKDQTKGYLARLEISRRGVVELYRGEVELFSVRTAPTLKGASPHSP
jgi:hypothetical protein